MNTNAAFAIKYDAFNTKVDSSFINNSKVKESDMTYMISVKVVNQVIYDYSLTKFVPISGLKAQNFSDIHGDCYISALELSPAFAKGKKGVEEAKEVKGGMEVTEEKREKAENEVKTDSSNSDNLGTVPLRKSAVELTDPFPTTLAALSRQSKQITVVYEPFLVQATPTRVPVKPKSAGDKGIVTDQITGEIVRRQDGH
ncbi:Fc.00g062120.m01.CDS01 [Cosmosporella sp. VM-42]